MTSPSSNFVAPDSITEVLEEKEATNSTPTQPSTTPPVSQPGFVAPESVIAALEEKEATTTNPQPTEPPTAVVEPPKPGFVAPESVTEALDQKEAENPDPIPSDSSVVDGGFTLTPNENIVDKLEEQEAVK